MASDEQKSPFFFVFILMLLVSAAPAPATGLIGNLNWGDGHEKVRSALEKICKEVRSVDVDTPAFPLAQETEQHLLCYDLSMPNGNVDAAAVVIADNKLTLIEARGGAVAAFVGSRTDQQFSYLDRRVFNGGELIAHKKRDTIWLSSKDALHVNLFAWSNPYLATQPNYAQSAAKPEILRFGENIEKLKPLFEQVCPLFNIETVSKPWLPSKPARQVQINCFGYEYAGFPRKIEAVFGDGILELAWILTGKGEEDRIRQALVKAFGQAQFVGKDWEVFGDKRVGLRKGKPEVLMISKKMVPYYAKQLGEELAD